MIGAATLLERVAHRRCVINATELNSDELLVSRAVAPYLYDFSPVTEESEELVNAVLDSSLTAIPILSKSGSVDVLEAIRRFWARVLARHTVSKTAREDIVHAYVFYFWAKIWEHSEQEPFVLEEAYIPQRRETWDVDSLFCEKLAPRFLSEAPVDVVALANKTVYLIEVKYGSADDRAVGQLLRYFESGRSLTTRVTHLCDLRKVVPVLVVRDFPKENWVSLPTSLRELIQVYYFDVDASDRLIFRDGREQLRAQLRGDRRYSY